VLGVNILNMDKKSKVLIISLIVIMILSVISLFYKTVITEDFIAIESEELS